MSSYDERQIRREEIHALVLDDTPLDPLPRTSLNTRTSLSKSEQELSRSEPFIFEADGYEVPPQADIRPTKSESELKPSKFAALVEPRKSNEKHNLYTSVESESGCSGSSTNFEFIILKRRKIAPVDSKLVSKCKCGILFDWYNRKHHCRGCGEVFCHECTSNRMKIPKILVCYINTDGWWKEKEVCRVCKPCSVKIVKYEAVLPELLTLYREPPLLHLINFATLASDKDKHTIGIGIPELKLSDKSSEVSSDKSSEVSSDKSSEVSSNKSSNGDKKRAKTSGRWSTGALSYYLSEMRLIQYLFPSDRLTQEQIVFLKVNRPSLFDHSYWLMQLLKVDDYDGEHSIPSPGIQTLCTRGCQPTLKLSDAIAIILFSEIYPRAQNLAYSILERSSCEDIECYLPILLTKQTPRLFQTMVAKITPGPAEDLSKSVDTETLTPNQSDSIIFGCSVYWQLNGIDTSTADIVKQKLLSTLPDTIINFRYVLSVFDTVQPEPDVNWYLPSLNGVVTEYDIHDPFNPLERILSVSKIWMGASQSKPIFVNYTTTGISMRNECLSTECMMYKKEDVRKDACIVRLVKVLAGLCSLATDPLVAYNVLPINSHSGMVQIVKRCQTLTKIYQAGSISNYLQKHNPNEIIKDVQDVYRDSLAFWTIVAYILGIGDRHFDNIMITETGRLFHIDFDFIFGRDSKFYAPRIRLNSYMIEGLGGEDKYGEFKEVCRGIFMDIRQNIDTVYVMLLNLVVAEPTLGITEPYIKEHLTRSFFIGELDSTIKDRLEFIIDACKDSLVGNINDYIHTAAKSTTGILSYFSS